MQNQKTDFVQTLNAISWHPEWERLAERLKLRGKDRLEIPFRKMVNEAVEIGRPRALYRRMWVSKKTEQGVVIGGQPFTSRVLRINLNRTDTVYPFLATSGGEMEDWIGSLTDPIHVFWADTIANAMLQAAVDAVSRAAAVFGKEGALSRMTPGSLDDWPLEEQPRLFALFENQEAEIGVELKPNGYMTPLRSISGLLFAADEPFVSCSLCPRQNCPLRQTPYQPELARTTFGLDTDRTDGPRVGDMACPEPG